ncbi:hypothetical protein, partial [Streptomyces albipurpureus]
MLDRHDLLRARLTRTDGLSLVVRPVGAPRAADLIHRVDCPGGWDDPSTLALAKTELDAAAGHLDARAGDMAR